MGFFITQTRTYLAIWDSHWRGVSDKIGLVADFLLRLTLAKVFFSSGWVKLNDWGSTLFLFEEEYKVPLIPADLAAYLATGAELGLAVLLMLGLLTRLSALGLFVLNGVAVLSYYDTLKDSPAALNDHWYWGLMLCIVLVLPLRQLSADYWLKRMK
jgi:putative oxidoreductase